MKPRIWITIAGLAVCQAAMADESREDAADRFEEARKLLHGKPDSDEKARVFELMMSAAKDGHADAASGVGYCYMTGTGVQKDPDKAVEWFRKGAELGSAKAQLNLARYLMGTLDSLPERKESEVSEKEKKEGVRWLRKSAEQGLTEAEASLGSYLYNGQHGIDRDRKEAEKWLLLAAKAGDANSQNTLGVLYDRGIPESEGAVRKDAGEAETWYRKAALQDHRKAQANLGKLLDPFSKDESRRIEALAWTMLARDNREPTAEKRLIEIGTAVDPTDMQRAAGRARELRIEVIKAQIAKKENGQ